MDLHLSPVFRPHANHGDGSTPPSSSSSSRNMLEVKEEAQWEACSPRLGRARNVRARNVNERNRLHLMQSALDKQLERELRRISTEKSTFNGVLEHLENEKSRLHVKKSRAPSRDFGSLPDLVGSVETARPHSYGGERRSVSPCVITRSEMPAATNGGSGSKLKAGRCPRSVKA